MENRRIDDEKFMRQALNEARRAFEQEEVPIGAVIVAGDRVIGRGHNLVETLRDATAHAEMQALTAAASTLGGKYLQECTCGARTTRRRAIAATRSGFSCRRYGSGAEF